MANKSFLRLFFSLLASSIIVGCQAAGKGLFLPASLNLGPPPPLPAAPIPISETPAPTPASRPSPSLSPSPLWNSGGSESSGGAAPPPPTPTPGPILTSLSETTGYHGDRVILTGQYFSATLASNEVKINGLDATVTAASTASLQVTVPAAASSGPLTLAVGGVDSGASPVFTVVPTGALASSYAVPTKPAGIAIDSQGNAWVANPNDNSVMEILADGSASNTYTVGVGPQAVAVDSHDDIWVANFGTGSFGNGNTVTKLAFSGGTSATYTVGPAPAGLAVDSHDNVWVANSGTNTATWLKADGSASATYPVSGSLAAGVAVDSNDNAWITSVVPFAGGNITKWSADRSASATFADTGGGDPGAIAVDAQNNVWYTSVTRAPFLNGPTKLTKLSSSGVPLFSHAFADSSHCPTGLAIDARGDAWVTLSNFNLIQEFSPTGALLGTYGAGLAFPFGVAIDKRNFVWITNKATGSLSVARLAP